LTASVKQKAHVSLHRFHNKPKRSASDCPSTAVGYFACGVHISTQAPCCLYLNIHCKDSAVTMAVATMASCPLCGPQLPFIHLFALRKHSCGDVAFQHIKAAKALVKIISHLQQILALIEPISDFVIAQLLQPIPIVVIIQKPAITPVCTLYRHFVIGTRMVSPHDSWCFLD